MRNLIHKILQLLNISRRDWAVFLLALLLAFSIWLIHNLSLKYTDFMQVSVEAVSNIEGHFNRSSNRCDVIARCQTTGYNIMRGALFPGKRKVSVHFDPSILHCKSGETFYMTSSELKESAHLIFGNDVQIEYFITDTLFFRFPFENHKRVPVNPVHVLSFRPQYTAAGPLEIEPDSVTIYGEPAHIDEIERVNTSAIKLSDISDGIHGVARLERIKGVRMSSSEVHYTMPVSRFVEIPVTVGVQAKNVPPGRSLLIYPSVATVTLRCAFPLTADLSEGIRVYVDYNDFASSLVGTCIARISSLPQGVLNYSISPRIFECVSTEEK